MIGPQQQPVALADAVVEPLLQVLFGDRLAGHLVAEVGDDGVAHEQLERQLMDLRAAAHVVLRGVDVAAGVQAHMHAAHDLAGAARRVVLLEDLHLELHVLLESRGRAHRVVLGIELEADVDDGLVGKRHGASLVHGAAADRVYDGANFRKGKHDDSFAADNSCASPPQPPPFAGHAGAGPAQAFPSPIDHHGGAGPGRRRAWTRNARLVAPGMSAALGQTVVIENVTGASGSDRHRPRRAFGTRWLHADLRRLRHPRPQRGGAESELRRGCRFRADRADRQDALVYSPPRMICRRTICAK